MTRKPENPRAAAQPCPCGGWPAGAVYARCCAPFIESFATTPAPDAHRLMRSRYSAFALGRSDYLLATWHANTRPEGLALDAATRWLGLQVCGWRELDGSRAEVEFIARSRTHGRASRLHERSRFVREADAGGTPRWFYVDGDFV